MTTKPHHLTRLMCSFLPLLALSPGNAAEAAKEAQIMVIAAPGGLVYSAGVELGGSGNSSLALRAGGFSYEYKDGSYWEDGSGSMLIATGRYYPTTPGEGLNLGAGISIISGESRWGGWGYRGYSSYAGVVPHAQVGYKFLSGKASFEPSLFVTAIPGNDVKAVIGIGLMAGIRF